MKVKDLMAELSAIDGDFDVVLWTNGGQYKFAGSTKLVEAGWISLTELDTDEARCRVHIG